MDGRRAKIIKEVALPLSTSQKISLKKREKNNSKVKESKIPFSLPPHKKKKKKEKKEQSLSMRANLKPFLLLWQQSLDPKQANIMGCKFFLVG